MCVSQAVGSPFGIWTTLNCDNGLLFDSTTSKCTEPGFSDCPKCKPGDEAPLSDECILHWHCQDGTHVILKCPGLPFQQIFDPESKQCIPKQKDTSKCPRLTYEKWTVSKCPVSLHFDPEKQADKSISTCGIINNDKPSLTPKFILFTI